MIRNILTGVVVTLLICLTTLWFVHNTHWEEVEVHTPEQGEAATNPFYSLQHLSEYLGAHTQVRHEIVKTTRHPGRDCSRLLELGNYLLSAASGWSNGSATAADS